jgi:ribonuclease HI
VEGLISGKGLAELAPAGDPARREIVRHLQGLLSKNRTMSPASPSSDSRSTVSPSFDSPTSKAEAILFCDGASRGNPGPAAIGFVLRDSSGRELAAQGHRIGTSTNNVAEYRAVLAGLERAHELGIEDLEIRLDSELVVRQLNGKYKVRHPSLIELKAQVDEILRRFRTVRILHVGREENGAADRLANEALDQRNEEA